MSALQQAEELFRAARVSGPATSPLLQFYGLSQAGRAVAAAAVSAEGDDWILVGHGIVAKNLGGPLPDVTLLTDSPNKSAAARGSFARLSMILGSPLWTPSEAPTVSRLWDLLPEAMDKPLEADDSRRTPLFAFPNSPDEGHPMVSARVSSLPVRLARTDATKADFDAFMASYPTATGYIPVVRQGGVPQYEYDRNTDTVSVQLGWEAGPTYPVPEEIRSARINAAISPYREGNYWLFPATIPGRPPLHPLMAWWAVLYALSMLARYQPAEWATCIDINSSPYANPVEYLLEEARTAVPDLVLTTLDQVST